MDHKPWPFVYRIKWTNAETGQTNTARIPEDRAKWWIREYTEEPPEGENVVIERAPVGDWEELYSNA